MFCTRCAAPIPDDTPRPLCPNCLAAAGEAPARPAPPRPATAGTAGGGEEPDAAPTVALRISYDPELERKIVNGFLRDPFLLRKARTEGFEREMLRAPLARILYDQLVALVDESAVDGATVDDLVVRNHLKSRGLFDARMEAYFEGVLAVSTPELAQLLAYMKILNEQLSKVRLFELERRIRDHLTAAPGAGAPPFNDFMVEVAREVRAIQSRTVRRNIELVKNRMIEIAQEINAREKSGELECLGLPMRPFADLTRAVSGLRKGFLYAVAGAPRAGKTTFVLEIATSVAAARRIPVLFFTWEQTTKNLTYRLLAKETRINPDTLQRRRILGQRAEGARFAEGWRRMETYMDNLYIVEGGRDDTVERVRSYAYNAMQDLGADECLIICDYLQKMPLSKQYMYAPEKYRVEEISTDLKHLSIELNCPVLVISSLSKDGCMIEATQNDDERPHLYHYKGSGDVEYDLDCALMLTKSWADSRELATQMAHRAEALGMDHIHLPKIDIMDLHIDKNRDSPEGKLSTIQYFFFVEENRFVELGYKVPNHSFRFRRVEGLLDKFLKEGMVKFRPLPAKRGGTAPPAPPPPDPPAA